MRGGGGGGKWFFINKAVPTLKDPVMVKGAQVKASTQVSFS